MRVQLCSNVLCDRDSFPCLIQLQIGILHTFCLPIGMLDLFSLWKHCTSFCISWFIVSTVDWPPFLVFWYIGVYMSRFTILRCLVHFSLFISSYLLFLSCKIFLVHITTLYLNTPQCNYPTLVVFDLWWCWLFLGEAFLLPIWYWKFPQFLFQ